MNKGLNFIKAAFNFDNLNNLKYFKLRVALLILYLWPVLFAQYILFIHQDNLRMFNPKDPTSLCWAADILFVLLLLCPKVIKLFNKISVKAKAISCEDTHKNFFAKSFIIAFIYFLIYYVVYYPGCFSPDSLNQIQEALTNKYIDWHPTLHTLLFFKLPLTLTGECLGSMVLMQIILFALALAYMANTIYKYANFNYACLALAYVLITPVTPIIVLYPWKDVAFAITAILLIAFMLNIYFTRGEWLNNFRNLILFAVILTFATIFRHNAVLFTAPLFLALIIYANKKHALIIFLISALLFAFIKIPVYRYVDAGKPKYIQREISGLPMTVIGNAVKETPELLSQDILDFAYQVAPKEKWQTKYITGSFNNIKWAGVNSDFIEQTGALKILKIMLKCFMQSPIAALKGFIGLTNLVHGFVGYTGHMLYPVRVLEGGALKENLWQINKFFQEILSPVLGHIGLINLIILICLIAKFKFKKLFLALPLLIYNFGTMLLLSGADFRFFYYSIAIMPALVLMLLNENKN
ncbi:MAG: hypothetical protein IJQ63_03200 [Synergistaceae bacterium]|nr:hypothetical protein [Synergistaceae bacterium]